MKKDVYDLSKPQESIWLTEQYFKDTNINRLITFADFSEQNDYIDFDLLNKAINTVIKYNDSFQIRLCLENGNIKQYFADFEEFNCEICEVSSVSDFLENDYKRKNIFTLLNSPLYEVKLFKLAGTNTGGILANFHHIIADGFSTGLFIKQIYECYNSLTKDQQLINPNPNNYSYLDYINSEKEYLNSEKFIKDKEYWQNLYETVPEVATIYSSKVSKSVLDSEAERKSFTLDSNLMEKINALCQELKISVYNFFMAVFGIYISRASRLSDFAIGTPILNRSNFKEKNTQGMYISTVPFRITLNDDLSFASFVQKISKDTMSMLRHQKYSYRYLLEDLRKKDSSIPNLYSIILSYQITKAAEEDASYSTGWLSSHAINGDLDITVYDLNSKNLLNIAYDYNLNKYDEKDIDLIHPRIIHIIEQILENKEILLENIDIATPMEKLQILNVFNNTKADYPRDKSVIELFEEQVKNSPDATAVCFEDKSLTYSELDKLSNSLACYLKENNVKAHDVVALYLDKSLEAIVSIVATLKLGACYMPIDISYPNSRILYMLSDSNAKAFLLTSDLNLDLNVDIFKVIVDLKSDIYKKNADFEVTYAMPNDLAYIIYTSGSTGTPKGVMIDNRSIVRLIKNTNFIEFSKGDRILQTGTIAFDASTFEIWGALLNGLELFLLKKTDLLNPNYFKDYINKNKITTVFLTTALFHQFCETDSKMFGNLKYLFVGGEAYSFKHFKLAKDSNPNLNFVHVYGPTENTTFSTYYNITDLSRGFIPIGYPIANSTCYVVSPSGKLQPAYVPGELWVGGDGVSLGYLNRDDLTKDKFIDNPFGEGKIYKTGDLTVLLPDGSINYIGRIDNQVKLRGFRIELSEIDCKILTFTGIKESITVIHDRNICSYIVTSEEISIDNLRKYLSDNLPAFMVPSFITVLDSLPLNINGKVDRKKLPPPSFGQEKREVVLPRNEIDKIIIDELKDILHLENISIDDSFFGIGGDSLTAITLSVHLSDKFNFSVSVKDIFDNPTIQNLSDFIANNDNSQGQTTISKAEEKDAFPLSFAQKRIYYANLMAGDKSILYNVSGGFLFENKLEAEKVQNALNKLLELHSSFRTIFTLENRRNCSKNFTSC